MYPDFDGEFRKITCQNRTIQSMIGGPDLTAEVLTADAIATPLKKQVLAYGGRLKVKNSNLWRGFVIVVDEFACGVNLDHIQTTTSVVNAVKLGKGLATEIKLITVGYLSADSKEMMALYTIDIQNSGIHRDSSVVVPELMFDMPAVTNTANYIFDIAYFYNSGAQFVVGIA